ncbi:PAS domain-containing protein [Pontiella sp.]|uniref:PAS domain-containing protein n=1 Tax=Pontiella sp. TaxID=2837462 RepID=UPI00356926F2
MVKKYPFQDAKAIIHTVCDAAKAGDFDTRDAFMSMLERNPHLAVQGYNAFGKIFFWNEAAVGLYGYREAEAVNQDIFELIIPKEMRPLARAQVEVARKTGKMTEAGACDLLRETGEFVTIYSGHLVFQWENGPQEFYCVDLALETEADALATAP